MWQVHVVSAFPLSGYYRAVFGWRRGGKSLDGVTEREVRSETGKKGFFINVTTVLPTFAPLVHPTDTLLGAAELSAASQGCQEVQNGKTAA